MARKRCGKRLQVGTYMLDQYDEIAAALGDEPVYRQPKGISKRFEKREQVYRGPKRKENAPSDVDYKKQHEESAEKRFIRQILTSRDDVLKTVTPDKFVGIPAVVGLTHETFKNYLRDYTAAMVLFYRKEIPLCTKVLPDVRETAMNLQKESHTFAAVDCTDQVKLCKSEGIRTLPSFKLYSLGKFMGQFDDNMNAEEMKRIFNRAPPSVRSDWKLRPEDLPSTACEEVFYDAENTWQDIHGTDYTMSPGRSPTDDNAMYSMNWL